MNTNILFRYCKKDTLLPYGNIRKKKYVTIKQVSSCGFQFGFSYDKNKAALIEENSNFKNALNIYLRKFPANTFYVMSLKHPFGVVSTLEIPHDITFTG